LRRCQSQSLHHETHRLGCKKRRGVLAESEEEEEEDQDC
jgi:hypothetical protein